MAETKEVKQNEEINLSDIISEQTKTIDTLVKQYITEPSTAQQPIYWTTPSITEKSTNYVMVILIGFIAWQFLRRR